MLDLINCGLMSPNFSNSLRGEEREILHLAVREGNLPEEALF